MVDAEGPEHGRVGHVIEHDRRYALRPEQGQVDGQADEDGIGNEKTSDEDALPVLADVQDFGRYAADGIGQKNRRKGQEQVRRDAEQRIMGEVLFQLAEHV